MISKEQKDQAVRWLLSEGYEVFVNIEPGTAGDFVIKKNTYLKEVRLFEVKYKNPNHKNKNNLDNLAFEWSLYLQEDEIRYGTKPLFLFGNQIGWNRDYFVPQQE